MNSTRYARLVTVLALLAAAIAFYESRLAKSTANALDVARNERDAARAEVAAAVRLARAPVASVASKTATSPDARSSEASRAFADAATTVTKQRPDARRFEQFRRRYGRFVQTHALSADQTTEFYRILAEWDDVSRDFQANIRAQGLTATPQAQQLRDKLQHEIEADPLTQLLGDQGARDYWNYERSSFFEAIVDPYADSLAQQSVPLTSEQRDKFVALVQANLTQVKRDPTAMGSEAIVEWQNVIAAAGEFLDQRQIEALRHSLQISRPH